MSTPRRIDLLVVHASDSPQRYKADDIRKWHTQPKPPAGAKLSPTEAAKYGNGWKTIGYHVVIEADGAVVRTLNEDQTGVHVEGKNTHSLAVVWVGGKDGKDDCTTAQRASLLTVLADWCARYSLTSAAVKGHREAAKTPKKCPVIDMDALRRDLAGVV